MASQAWAGEGPTDRPTLPGTKGLPRTGASVLTPEPQANRAVGRARPECPGPPPGPAFPSHPVLPARPRPPVQYRSSSRSHLSGQPIPGDPVPTPSPRGSSLHHGVGGATPRKPQ